MEASALHPPAGLSRTRTVVGPLLRLRSDEQLVALFRAGSDEAFRVIHDRYRARLFAYVRQMLPGGRPDAEDALQDVFVRAYRALRASERDVSLRAWLYRVAHNRCVDELRRPPLPDPAVLEIVRPPEADPVAEAERRDRLRRLIQDVRRLPEQQRSALLMRELSGMSYDELAGALDTTVPAIKSLLVRARISLAASAEARDAACVDIREELVLARDRGVRASGLARRHLHDCAGCRDFRRELRAVNRGFAALLPAAGPAALVFKIFGGGGSAAGGAAAGGGGGALVGGGLATGGGIIAISTPHVVALVAAAAVTAGGTMDLIASPPAPRHHAAAAPATAHRASPLAAAAAQASSAPTVLVRRAAAVVLPGAGVIVHHGASAARHATPAGHPAARRAGDAGQAGTQPATTDAGDPAASGYTDPTADPAPPDTPIDGTLPAPIATAPESTGDPALGGSKQATPGVSQPAPTGSTGTGSSGTSASGDSTQTTDSHQPSGGDGSGGSASSSSATGGSSSTGSSTSNAAAPSSTATGSSATTDGSGTNRTR